MNRADADPRFWSPARARRWATLALLAVSGTAYAAPRRQGDGVRP